MTKLVKIAPWIVGLLVVLWSMEYLGFNPKDVLDTVSDKSRQFAQDASDLATGTSTARLKEEYQAKKFVVEMPDTSNMDEETKKMVIELNEARQEMIDQRRQAADQRINTLFK